MIILFAVACFEFFYGQQTRRMEVPPFKAVEVLGNFEVVLEQGQENGVMLIGTEQEVERVKISVKGGILRISDLKSMNKRSEVTVVVKYVQLVKLLATAGSLVYRKSEWAVDSLEIICSSGAKVDFTFLAQNLTVSVDKGATVSLKGRAKLVDAEASTGGIFDAYELICDSAKVRSNTGGLAKVYVKNYLEANAGAGGEISYRGIPKKIVPRKVLGGKIEQMIE
jgi:hypothetical protein